MGTRHLIAVKHEGEYRIAQYGQWDGYLSGQGVEILSFLKDNDMSVFKEKLSQLSAITDEELDLQWQDAGAPPGADSVGMDIADKFNQLHPENGRDCGAKIFGIVFNAEQPLKLRYRLDFAQDGLFCEYAYVIDFDENVFEVWTGFHKEAVENGRFPGPLDENGYGPVQLRNSWSLDALPSEEEFLATDVEEKEKASAELDD